jgi:hypothetical protein
MIHHSRVLIARVACAAALALNLIGAGAASAQGPLSDAGVLVFHGHAGLNGTIPDLLGSRR